MVFITEQLIRKKSEHNELIIGTLEELSLHQEDVEKIEHVHNWCRELKILLLQSNLIGKIENLSKLKKLEYLNLALNNIERIENLDALESLSKLDLTLNFIGDLISVNNLRDNYNLKELILTGNPCTDYRGYREYVITVLPQLNTLDGACIKRHERITANAQFTDNKERIAQLQAEYVIKRDEQKVRVQNERDKIAIENQGLTEDEINEKFWKSKSENCPETRRDISIQQRKYKSDSSEPAKKKREKKLFADCGRPYNLNEAKLEFRFRDERTHYELNLFIYRFLDTSLIDVDLQPKYVRVTVKQKIFQIALNDEIKISESTTQRSQMTGNLLIIMPKLTAQGEVRITKHDVKLTDKCNTRTTPGGLNEFFPNGNVNYKKIVKQATSSIIDIDESEVPDLC